MERVPHIAILEKMRRSFGKVMERPLVGEGLAGWGGSTWIDTGRVLGYVVSPTFEGMPDHKRQEIVWGRLLDDFTSEERAQIEFVSTYAPSDYPEGHPRRTHFEKTAGSGSNG